MSESEDHLWPFPLQAGYVGTCQQEGGLSKPSGQLSLLTCAPPHFLHKQSQISGGHNSTNILSCAETTRMWESESCLVVAAGLGHMDCVRYLVERCNTNIKEAGSVTTNKYYVREASPVWAATLGGHLNIVKYLTSKGACVSLPTYCNSTPLKVACYPGRQDLVKVLVQNGADFEDTDHHEMALLMACFKGHSQLVNYLLDFGANLNRKTSDGKSALHLGVYSGCLDVVKVLIDHKWEMNIDTCGETPLLAASLRGHDHIVEYLIARGDLISKEEGINALELLGTTFAEKKQDVAGAFKYWKLALHERCVHNISVKQDESQMNFNHHFKEVTTPQQLEEFRGNREATDTHSLLVKMRVLGSAHHDTICAIRNRGAEFAANGQLKLCVVLWMYTLEAHRRILGLLNPVRFFFLKTLTYLFLKKVIDQSLPSDILLYFEDFMNMFENSTKEIRVSISETNRKDFYQLDRIIPIVMHLVLLLIKLKPILSPVQLQRVNDAVIKLVGLNPRDSDGESLLHLACSRYIFRHSEEPAIISFPSLEVLKLLLETGANPCARDSSGNTPLHALAKRGNIPGDMLEALLAAGAHLDMTNEGGQSFGSLMASRGQGQKLHEIVNPVRHTSLQCLAAAAIRRNGIPYKGVLDNHLSQFVDFH
ncbi:protein fem-1 homolog A-like [Palaemon carinicauda]|uniref:protein fem-1 homolog A-like n=1 Tax=Palaemon carinicauda TaxID=392227 RepID=UPI0035B67D92